jgi:hypothetical protein
MPTFLDKNTHSFVLKKSKNSIKHFFEFRFYFSQSETYIRQPSRRPEPEVSEDELQFGEDFGTEKSQKTGSASEQVGYQLVFAL